MRSLAPLLLSLLPGCVHGGTRCSPEPAALRAEIEAAHDALEARFRAGDLRGIAEHYTEDALLLGPGEVRVSGRPAIADYWGRVHGATAWELEVLEVGGRGDLLYELGRSTLVHTRAGEEVESVVLFCGIWRRQEDGSLKLAVDAYWAERP